MTSTNKNHKGPAVKSKLVALINHLSEEMQIKLLRYLEKKLNIKVGNDLTIEKRGNHRRTCLISVAYIIGKETFSGYILDISAFGAFIETNVIFPAGEKLSMSFSLPNHHKPFKFNGQIVWSGSQGIGVKFNTLSSSQKEILKIFTEQSEEIFEIIS
ncbi:MAG: PilZ domain-containing protein [Thermodesulfobacteriota bacterium]|nr:PilZ domain-containing protein [Thermodesulfobacteriota bacterium]